MNAVSCPTLSQFIAQIDMIYGKGVRVPHPLQIEEAVNPPGLTASSFIRKSFRLAPE